MLKWFRRDKNDPQVASAPAAEHPGVPASAEGAHDAGGAERRVDDPGTAPTQMAVEPILEVADGDAPKPSTSDSATAVEAAVPWWRYEGVWRSPKAPAQHPIAPPAAVPAAPDPAPAVAPAREAVPEQAAVAPAAEVHVPPEAAPAVQVQAPPEAVSAAQVHAPPEAAPAVQVYAPPAAVPAVQVHAPPASVPAVQVHAPATGAAAGDDAPRISAEANETVPTLFVAEEPVPGPAKPRSLRERLAATARALTASVGSLFKRNPKLDEDLLEELETALIQADVGVTASTELVARLGTRMRKREFADAQALLAALRSDLRALIVNHARPLHIPAAPRPFVILTVGVNGAGKTTTIGKLAMRYKQAGHSVMLAAGDTFRAAAVEQLKTWGDRNQVAVIAQGSGADSASVIFDALQAAKSRNIDVLIADTAGRLHTQGHLMQELAKVKRVLGKIDPAAPHETLLVIDGGTGQNALNQAKQFHQAVGLTGIVVTKLDGTAKGGMVFALCRELGLPIRFIGVGEKREDLREFVAEDFVDALLPRELGG